MEKKYFLGELVNIDSGFAFKSSLFTDDNQYIPIIRIRDVNSGEASTYYSGEYDEKYIVNKGDLLISMDGSFVVKKWNSKKALLNQRVCRIKSISDKITDEYLYRILPRELKAIEDKTPFVTVKHLSTKSIENIEIKLPSLEKQKKISEVLDKAQSLIDKKREQIELLDELVKSRFVEMFGDPVNNPKSFEILTIGDLTTDVKYGTSKSSSDGGKYPYLRMNNITYDGKLDLNDLKYIDIDDNELEKYIVKKGDVLFNRTNSIELIGKTCVFELDEPMIIAGYIIRVRLKNNILPIYLSTFLNSSYGKTLLRGMAKGAVNQANINAQELKSIKVHVPPIELQNEFAEFVTKIDSIRSKMEASLSELEDNFNSLMQKAFKGEVF